jgi:tetratricopeptide (TPR) repeat protein
MRRVGVTTLAQAPAADRAQWLAPLLSDPVKAVRLDAALALADLPREALRPYQHDALKAGIAEYEQAMAYSLDFSSAGINLGNLYRSLAQPDLAEKHYRLALKVDDLFFPAKMNLAVLLSGQGRQAEAETLLREVVRDYPANTDAAYSLGLLLAELGKPEEALGHLRRAAQGETRNARVRYNFGLLAQQLGRLEEAEAALTSALVLEPANPDILLALADHYYRRNRPADVLPLAERLIAAAPGDPTGRQLAAWARQPRR